MNEKLTIESLESVLNVYASNMLFFFTALQVSVVVSWSFCSAIGKSKVCHFCGIRFMNTIIISGRSIRND